MYNINNKGFSILRTPKNWIHSDDEHEPSNANLTNRIRSCTVLLPSSRLRSNQPVCSCRWACGLVVGQSSRALPTKVQIRCCIFFLDFFRICKVHTCMRVRWYCTFSAHRRLESLLISSLHVYEHLRMCVHVRIERVLYRSKMYPIKKTHVLPSLPANLLSSPSVSHHRICLYCLLLH